MSIILLQDLLDIRKRKQQEIEYYTIQLTELHMRMNFIRQEINLTSKIIELIESEKILDFNKFTKDQNDSHN
tara:strand:- start:3993 stop:4208 length:216 start_codon:yes stop_codon:yes gene_type:complete